LANKVEFGTKESWMGTLLNDVLHSNVSRVEEFLKAISQQEITLGIVFSFFFFFCCRSCLNSIK